MPSISPRRRVRVCPVKVPKNKKGKCFYLSAGDHLSRPIQYTRGRATHHGIYVGNGNVIHFTKTMMKQDAVIAMTSFEEFMDNFPEDDLILVEYEGPTLSSRRAVRKAIELLHTKEYNLMHNNCEHFVTECITGEKKSQQAIDAFNRFFPKFMRGYIKSPHKSR
jgi:hypothetical protein